MAGSMKVARYRSPENPDMVLYEGDGEWGQRGILDESERNMPVMPAEVFKAITNAVANRQSMGGPTRDERPPQLQTWSPPQFEDAPAPAQRPAVAAKPPPPTVRPGAAVDTSEMLARYSGVTQDKSAPDSMPAALKGLMGAAQPRALASFEQEHPAVQKVLASAGFGPKGDPEMMRANVLGTLSRAGSQMGHALDPLKAALMGERDTGEGMRRGLAEADARDPVEALKGRRGEEAAKAQVQAEVAKRDPNSPISQRARQNIERIQKLPPGALGDMSAAEVEKMAPLMIKQIESEMAREDRKANREDSQNFQAQQNAMNRAQSGENARLTAGLSVAREDRSEARTVAREDRTEQRKRDAAAVEIEERFRNAKKALQDLDKQIADEGTWDAYGSGPAIREGLITSYATDMAKLRDPTSVAREGEVALERKALGEPGFFTRNSTAREVIQKQIEALEERRAEAYRVRGLTPQNAATDRAVASPASAGVAVVGPNGERGTIDPGEVAEAEANGWRRL